MVEFLQVLIRYSKPEVDMTGAGHVGARQFLLESDSSFLSSGVKVTGALGDEAFTLRGRTKNFRNRDFTVSGSWGGLPMELRLRAKGRRYLVDGDAGLEAISYDIRRSLDGELWVVPQGNQAFDLHFRSDFDAVLEGKVPDYLTGGVFAAFLPCLIRNLHGSIDPIPASDQD